jgi:DNA-binding response OmpR family regulator
MTEERERKTVLYIEDEPELIQLVSLILERAGYKPIGAIGGREGLEMAQRVKPDLVLLDLVLPDLNGWDVYRRLKSDAVLRDIPIVVVSVMHEWMAEIGNRQMDQISGCVLKPFLPRELLETINRTLEAQSY